MKKTEDTYILHKTLISDNGIDRVYRPVLDEEEHERRKKEFEKACIRLIREQDRAHSKMGV